MLCRKLITQAENRLRKAKTTEEVTWLFHELARYHLELKHGELARVYARKCINTAWRINNLNWVVCAKMLIARVNIHQHNRNDARLEVQEALSVAEQMNNRDLKDFLKKVRDHLNILIILTIFVYLYHFLTENYFVLVKSHQQVLAVFALIFFCYPLLSICGLRFKVHRQKCYNLFVSLKRFWVHLIFALHRIVVLNFVTPKAII